MEGRKAKGVSHQRPARVDLISNLPEALISQILSYLPTKEAVKTSVLSSRWKSLWLLISGLDLDSSEFPDYSAFKSCLHKLKLSIRKTKNEQSCVTRWVDSVATPKLEHLDVGYTYVCRKRLEVIPVSLFVCETLLYIKLNRVLLGSFESVSLPRLKTLRLEKNTYANGTCLESLISSCPVLEDLSIVRRLDDNLRVLRVHSQTLTCLSVGFDLARDYGFSFYDWDSLALFIDAPRLKYMNLDEELSPNKTISNSGSLVKVNFVSVVRIARFYFGFSLSDQQMVRNFFNSISGVRDLIISEYIIELISYYMKLEPFPQFCNLSSLVAEVWLRRVKILEILPTLLESFPNLKSIVLDLTHSMVDTPPITVSSVPQCLLSSLEFVEIKSRYEANYFILMELARYFAENSVILKKLVVRWERSKLEEDSVLRDLLALPWRSNKCQIEVCGPLKRLEGDLS
ncbi:hypothetical protein EUTSA_v10013502mg [Eutrema salsugineum]|uniref:F-box domain-containing protein n=1 Tax=Eutrema salsugineum TaxID=72664 RepID=V4LQT9_EUTSA|nr:hypothetical protein EUTSA_v10013502mg [Eutrema salsugineum]